MLQTLLSENYVFDHSESFEVAKNHVKLPKHVFFAVEE